MIISIIIASYNSVKTIELCLKSIYSQSYPHIEIIVIDGFSTDGTIDILKKYVNAITYWSSEPDSGIYNAWNKGLKQATGEWIYFLGSDDFLYQKDTIERVANQLKSAYPNYRIAYGSVALVDRSGFTVDVIGMPWEKSAENFLRRMTIPHQGVFHHKTLFQSHGTFDESFFIIGDYEFLLRELLSSKAAFMKDIIVAGMQQGGISNDPKHRLLYLRESFRIKQKHHLSVLNRHFAIFTLKSIFRILLYSIMGRKHSDKIIQKCLALGRPFFRF